MALKGNTNQEAPKLKSDNMIALLSLDRDIRANDTDSPSVNKRNLKLMQDAEKGEEIKNTMLDMAGFFKNELGMIDRNCLKNAVAVDLDEPQEIYKRIIEYCTSCAATKMPPNLLTFYSIGLGLTAVRVNNYIRQHNNASTELLCRFKDAVGGVLTKLAQKGDIDTIMTIFAQKNLHGMADNVRIEAAMPEQAPQVDESALKAEYEAFAKANGIDLAKDITDEQ